MCDSEWGHVEKKPHKLFLLAPSISLGPMLSSAFHGHVCQNLGLFVAQLLIAHLTAAASVTFSDTYGFLRRKVLCCPLIKHWFHVCFNFLFDGSFCWGHVSISQMHLGSSVLLTLILSMTVKANVLLFKLSNSWHSSSKWNLLVFLVHSYIMWII